MKKFRATARRQSVALGHPSLMPMLERWEEMLDPACEEMREVNVAYAMADPAHGRLAVHGMLCTVLRHVGLDMVRGSSHLTTLFKEVANFHSHFVHGTSAMPADAQEDLSKRTVAAQGCCLPVNRALAKALHTSLHPVDYPNTYIHLADAKMEKTGKRDKASVDLYLEDLYKLSAKHFVQALEDVEQRADLVHPEQRADPTNVVWLRDPGKPSR